MDVVDDHERRPQAYDRLEVGRQEAADLRQLLDFGGECRVVIDADELSRGAERGHDLGGGWRQRHDARLRGSRRGAAATTTTSSDDEQEREPRAHLRWV